MRASRVRSCWAWVKVVIGIHFKGLGVEDHSPKNLSSRAKRSGVEGSAVAFHNRQTPERHPEELLPFVRDELTMPEARTLRHRIQTVSS